MQENTLLDKGVGGVPEWSKGSDCKSDGSAFVGSNPTPSTIVGNVTYGAYAFLGAV